MTNLSYLFMGFCFCFSQFFAQALGQGALLAQILTHFSLFSIFLGFGDAQGDLLVFGVHTQDFHFHFLTDFQDIFRFFDPLFSDFGNMDIRQRKRELQREHSRPIQHTAQKPQILNQLHDNGLLCQ